MAVNGHGRAIGRGARVAVGVAHGHQAHAGALGGGEGSAIAQAVAHFQPALGKNAAFQRHDWLQRGAAGARRGTVEHDACAPPVLVRLGPGQDGGRVADAAPAGQIGGGGVKSVQLRLGGRGGVQLIGPGQVGEKAHLFHLGQRRQAGVGGGNVVRCKAYAVHTAIHFEPNVQRGPGMLLDQLQLLRLVGHQPQLVLGGQLDIVGRKGPFQHQDGLGDAGGAQRQGFFDKGHGKGIGRGAGCGQRLGTGQGTVAVGVGFEHGKHPPAMGFFGGGVVRLQGGKVDLDPGRAAHAARVQTLPARI